MIRIWHPREAPGLLMARGVEVKIAFPLHWHEEYQICLVERGAGEMFCRGSYVLNPPASLMVVHPGEVHSNRATTAEGCTHRTMNVAPEMVAGDAKTLPYFPQSIYDADLIARFSLLHKSWDDETSRMERESRMAEFFAEMRASIAQATPAVAKCDRRAVRLAREYLAAHFAENPSLAALAAIAGLSPFHLLRLFRAETGMPPHAWLTRLRVVRARKLLASGRAIADVAAETGFADQSHLTRCFKALVGVTPGVYRYKRDFGKNVQDPQRCAA